MIRKTVVFVNELSEDSRQLSRLTEELIFQ